MGSIPSSFKYSIISFMSNWWLIIFCSSTMAFRSSFLFSAMRAFSFWYIASWFLAILSFSSATNSFSLIACSLRRLVSRLASFCNWTFEFLICVFIEPFICLVRFFTSSAVLTVFILETRIWFIPVDAAIWRNLSFVRFFTTFLAALSLFRSFMADRLFKMSMLACNAKLDNAFLLFCSFFLYAFEIRSFTILTLFAFLTFEMFSSYEIRFARSANRFLATLRLNCFRVTALISFFKFSSDTFVVLKRVIKSDLSRLRFLT